MSCVPSIRVVNGRDNTDSLVFGFVSSDGIPELFDFSGVTRVTLELDVDGVATVIDSDISIDAIDWTGGSGGVEFDLGGEGIPVGSYAVSMFIYTPAWPNGYLMDVNSIGYSFEMVVI